MVRNRKTPVKGDSAAHDGAEAGSAVDAFVAKVAAMPKVRPAAERGRLLFAMDATMSRQPTWDRACKLQGEMFLATRDIGGLDVQLVFFRGFGELKKSPWVSDAGALLRLMSSVSCRGGYTQIERVLELALKETGERKVDAVVYVGDCCEEEADRLCHLAGRLGVLGVPVFLFHEGGDPIAAMAFREMARLSGGAYAPFDAGSADQLKDLLRAVAVYAAGGRSALQRIAGASARSARLLLEQIR